MLIHTQDNIGFVKLVDKTKEDFALKIVNTARISYGNTKQEFDDKDKKLVSYLWEHKHTSPFRHSFYTFHIKATMSVFRQWLKHQVGTTWRTYEINGETVNLDIIDLFFDIDKGCSWNELSRRYAQPKHEYYVPDKLRSNPPHGNKQASGEYVNPLSSHDILYLEDPLEDMREHTERSLGLYRKLVANGVAKEIARDVLPGNLYTEAYWTVSLQAVMLFLDLRDSPTAQFEIREYAKIIRQLIAEDVQKAGLDIDEQPKD